MQYRKLGNTDMVVSHLGFGASSLGSVFRSTDDEESMKVVDLVVKSGVNYIDTAPWYGQGKSEQVLGKALRGIPRSSYYLATKVGRYDKEVSAMFDFSYGRIVRSIDESLERLGLPYVDLIQAHDIEYASSPDIIINETLPALQAIKDAGKARYIGITGYPLSVLKEVVQRSMVPIDTVLTYCRYSLNDTALLEYLDFFKERGIGVINASPLSMGLLSTRGPPDWHPARNVPTITTACQQAAEFCTSKGVDISRLALHFSLAQADCATCLVSTASLVNAQKNIDTVTSPLTVEEKEVLQEVKVKFMETLTNAHWEGFEVQEYREKLENSTQSS